MKLALETHSGYHINRYQPGEIEINGQVYTHSVLIIPGEPIQTWSPNTIADLQPEDFKEVLQRQPEVLLLGSGATLQFPPPELTAPCTQAKIGVEVMDTRAACRTFNLLSAEDRNMIAALMI